MTPPELYSNKIAFPVLQSLASYQIQSDPLYPRAAQNRIGSLINLYQASAVNASYFPVLNDTIEVLNTSSQTLSAAGGSYKAAVAYPNTPLAVGLRLLAEAITGGVGLDVAQVALGSFDTHADQTPIQSQLFTTLAEAVFAFYQDLKAHNKDGDVVMMTWSEFGRRVQSNASGGTDHGTAAPMFIIGTPVIGGFYGERPDLGNLNNGNLIFTTDFRAVYATMLEKWLGVSADGILGPNQFQRLNFLPS